MWDDVLNLYQELSSNSIAMSIIVTPLISGVLYFFFKKVPLAIWRWLQSLITINVEAYQAIDYEAFITSEYLLSKCKLFSFYKWFTLRTVPFVKKSVFTIGTNTTFWGIYDGILFTVTRRSDNESRMDHKFVLKYRFFTRNIEKVNKIFSRMDEEKKLSVMNDEITIYYPDRWSSGWYERSKTKSTINYLTKSQKEIVNRVLNYVRKNDFERCGIILHGEGGTGKGSTVMAIAAALGYKIYFFNAGTLRDDSFISLISDVYTPSILLFEDIDCCKVTHARTTNVEDETDEKSLVNTISLSTLLNVFDGLLSLDKQIVIATTNHYDKLDPALVRKGRFDITIELKKLSTSEIVEFISHKFKVDTTQAEQYMQSLYTGDWSLPIACISSACKEGNDYKQAIEIIYQDSILNQQLPEK